MNSLSSRGRFRPWRLIAAACLGLACTASAQTNTEPATIPKRSDFRRTLPLTKFYDTPAPLPSAKPGTLIGSERTYDYWLAPEIATVRILYHSRSADGQDVASSGVVLFPADRTPPKGGWPVIAWAHGFEGVARGCAPSLVGNLYEGSFLSMYVNLGYAVVATDYAGLGTNFRNAFVDGQSNAADVIYSVPAARSAVRDLGPRWVAMGASEGALAAVAVAEVETALKDPDYLGAVAIAGPADLSRLYQHLAQGPYGNMIASLAYGIKTIFPAFQPTDILTDKAVPVYQRAETTCSGAMMGPDISAKELLKPGWQANKFVEQFFARNTVGEKPAYGPLLIIGSEADPGSPPPMTASVVSGLCKQGDRVQFYTYQSPNPKGVIGDSVRDQIEWIAARFAGRRAPTNCH